MSECRIGEVHCTVGVCTYVSTYIPYPLILAVCNVVMRVYIHMLSAHSAAPEVLGPEHYDLSCDMWSIGVMTYIL